MKSTFQAVKQFIRSEDGPTAVEYAVVVALIIVVAAVGIAALGTNLNTWFGNIGADVANLGTDVTPGGGS